MQHTCCLRTSAPAACRMCSSYANWRRSKYYEVSVVSPLAPLSVDSTRADSVLGVLHFVFRPASLSPLFHLFSFPFFPFTTPPLRAVYFTLSLSFDCSPPSSTRLSSSGSSNQGCLRRLIRRPFFARTPEVQERQYEHVCPANTRSREIQGTYTSVTCLVRPFSFGADPTSGELRATRPRNTSPAVLLTH